MHHAGIKIKVDMSEALDEMISWANSKGNQTEDLIIISLIHESGDNAESLVKTLI
jgi:hypothetical protein